MKKIPIILILLIVLFGIKPSFAKAEEQPQNCKWSIINKNGTILVQQFYTSGQKLTDPFTILAESNIPEQQTCLVNFEKAGVEGHIVGWFQNGNKRFESDYKNGKRHGKVINWYKSGQKESEGNYINGNRQGSLIFWYENGQKSNEGNYVNDQLEGIRTTWYKDGQKMSETKYVDGATEMTYWYKNGQKEIEVKIVDGKLRTTTCTEEGVLKEVHLDKILLDKIL